MSPVTQYKGSSASQPIKPVVIFFLNHVTELTYLANVMDGLAKPAQYLGSDLLSHILPVRGKEGKSPRSSRIKHLLWAGHCTKCCLIIASSPYLYTGE